MKSTNPLSRIYYVYQHIRLDTGEVFYVGKGHGKRHLSHSDRNRYWENITNKASFSAQIVSEMLTEIEAYDLEIELIAHYRSLNQCEANLTKGGEGGPGSPPGEKNPFFGKKHSDEWKAKRRITRALESSAMKGKQHSEETKAKVSASRKGKCAGTEHHRFKGLVVTPIGKFETLTAAAQACGVTREAISKRIRSKSSKWSGYFYETTSINSKIKIIK